jgi:hypothetical protein
LALPARALLDRVSEAYGHGLEQGDWEPAKRLYHRDALILASRQETEFITPAEFLDPDALRRIFLVGSREIISIDEHAGLIRGTARFQDEHERFRTLERVWLFTFRDGLIYRQHIAETVEEAETLYRHVGIDLRMH